MLHTLLYYILPSLSVVFSLSMILFSFIRGKKSATLYSFIFCHIVSTVWTVGQLLETLSASSEQMWTATVIKFLAITYTAGAWLLFVLLFTNRVRNLAMTCTMIFALPTIFSLSIATNRYHYLFFSDYTADSRTPGILFWLHTSVSYFYLVAAIVLLLITMSKCVKKYRIQYILLVASIVCASFLNILHVFRIVDTDCDLTPIGFVFSSFAFFVAVFRYRFLDLLPVAITNILDAIPQVIMALDSNNEISYTNKAFYSFLPGYKPSAKNDLSSLKEYLKKRVYIDKTNLEVLDRIILENGDSFSDELEFKWPNLNKTLIFRLDIIPIQERSISMGRIIIFSDITEYKHLINENIRKNESLTFMAQKLLQSNIFSDDTLNIPDFPIQDSQNKCTRI